MEDTRSLDELVSGNVENGNIGAAAIAIEETVDAFIDRRKRSGKNKARRFLNDYWLIPLFIIYLQLYNVLYATGDPMQKFIDANVAFMNGFGVMKELVMLDFPFALKGHMEETSYLLKYKMGEIPVSSNDLELQINSIKPQIYSMIMTSRRTRNSEVGGLVFRNGEKLEIVPVMSQNSILSQSLRKSQTDINQFLGYINDPKNINIMNKVGMDPEILNDTRENLLNPKNPPNIKNMLAANFAKLFDTLSEYNYILMPLDFKRVIGRTGGEYIGFFHIHNGYYEEPSDVDMERSYEERQIIFTLSNNGFLTYDVVKGNTKIIHTLT